VPVAEAAAQVEFLDFEMIDFLIGSWLALEED
jgi:hypothetical protein